MWATTSFKSQPVLNKTKSNALTLVWSKSRLTILHLRQWVLTTAWTSVLRKQNGKVITRPWLREETVNILKKKNKIWTKIKIWTWKTWEKNQRKSQRDIYNKFLANVNLDMMAASIALKTAMANGTWSQFFSSGKRSVTVLIILLCQLIRASFLMCTMPFTYMATDPKIFIRLIRTC